MRNIKLTIQYDGTNYSGWQSQKNARSIQDVIEARLKKLLGHKINLTGSGRTDAGVHALGQVANFHTGSRLRLKNIQLALNSAMPKDIVISHIEEAVSGFNAQRSAKSKLYRYIIANGDFVDPLIRHFAAKCFYRLDIGAMRKAAGYFRGRHDFRAFRAVDGFGEKNSVRTIKALTIAKKGKLVYIYLQADGFLYNMARGIVGTLVEAGRGKISARFVKEIIKRKDRRLCGPTMPAKGLCLVSVGY